MIHRLRQHHEAEGEKRVQAERGGGLALLGRHRQEAGADDFRHARAFIDGEGEQAGRQDVEPEAELRQHGIEEEDLGEERGAAKDPEIEPGDEPEEAGLGEHHRRHRSAD